jgi:signal transduction histidine kinase
VKINGEDCLMGVGYDMTEKLMYQQQLKDLANHLQNIREEEQTRISREIHDELGQQMTGMKLQLSMLKKQYEKGENNITDKLSELIQLADETLKSTRRISIQLRPSILDDLGLIPAMEWLLDDVKKKYTYSLIFKTHVQDIDISPVLSSAIYRIFQESMTNIIRHAHATIINISLDINDEFISLSILDNGKGFDTKTLPLGKTLGILGMKERAEMIGAFFDVYSAVGEGTKIVIRKNLNNEQLPA